MMVRHLKVKTQQNIFIVKRDKQARRQKRLEKPLPLAQQWCPCGSALKCRTFCPLGDDSAGSP
jgi:hypothetical protein